MLCHAPLRQGSTLFVSPFFGCPIAPTLCSNAKCDRRPGSPCRSFPCPRFSNGPPNPKRSTIEATLNYIVNNGEKLFTVYGRTRLDRCRTGGTPDPQRVTMHNGRPHAEGIRARSRRLPLRAPRHQDHRFLRRGRDHSALLPGDGGADEGRERRQARRGVRPHAAHRRRRAAREEARSARSCAASTTTTPNGPARSACATSCPTRPRSCSSAASPSSRCGGRSAIRSRPIRWRSATRARRARRFRDLRAALSRPHRPDLRDHLQPGHHWYWFPRMRRDEALVFKVYDSRRTAAPAGPRTPPSTTRPRRRTPDRAKASRSARWRSFRRYGTINSVPPRESGDLSNQEFAHERVPAFADDGHVMANEER